MVTSFGLRLLSQHAPQPIFHLSRSGPTRHVDHRTDARPEYRAFTSAWDATGSRCLSPGRSAANAKPLCRVRVC
jgi:hypothetical protein